MKGSRRLVIDTSVARASGGADATDPTAKNCRDFLQAVLKYCHRALFLPPLNKEWKKHGRVSKFAQRWQVAMERRRKLDWIEAETDGELHETITEAAASEKDKDAMEKDAFLLEAALKTTDRMVVSLDTEARGLFRELSGKLPRIGKIVWVNPGSEDDSAVEWLRCGAKPEPFRRLGYQGRKKR